MVYWFLSSIVSASLQVLLEKFVNLGIIAYTSISNVEDKLKKLERTLLRVQALLYDAEDKQRNDQAWQVVLADLEDLAYDADDLLDETAINITKLDSGNHGYKDQVSKLLLSLFKTTSAPNMNSIQVKLDGILKEVDSLCLREMVQGRYLTMSLTKLQSSSLPDADVVFGRQTEKKELLRMLCEFPEEPLEGSVSGSDHSHSDDSDEEGENVIEPPENNVLVVSVVGMAGVGKTRLVQCVYHDKKVKENFSHKMWISVTKEFDVVRLTKSIIEAATGRKCDVFELNLLQVMLRRVLSEVQFLLVFDDLWNEKHNEWDVLLKPLRYGRIGSKIIVTTRSRAVASMVSTGGIIYLGCLWDQDCWSVLKLKALGNSNANAVKELIEIGRQIAKKCRGLPLAAKVLGRLLHSTRDEDEWEGILKSKIWDLPEVRDEIDPSLRLSYHILPLHLKQCFAYCSMFPQNHSFEEEKIVQMWIAEGIIQPEGTRRMEDIGSDYLKQLFSMSLMERVGRMYKMHDAAHYFAQSSSGNKFFSVEENHGYINRNTRHCSLLSEGIRTTTLDALDKCKGLRTFIAPVKDVPFALFQKLKRLRVLDLSHSQIQHLTANIGNLKHLRFLDLSKTLLEVLPDTTRDLCSLQTLKLNCCPKLLCLPDETGRLTCLKHLEFGGSTQLTSLPSGIGKLVDLETLSDFIVGSEMGQLKELAKMNMLRGTLSIKQLEKVNNPQEAEDAKLSDKRYIAKLLLHWSSSVSVCNEDRVLNNLKPHESVKELTVRRYGGRMFPTWVSSPRFSKLTSIYLFDCRNCTLLPYLGQLPKLESLKIVGMHELKTVDSMFEGGSFPSLRSLELCDMPKLESWNTTISNNGNLSCLKELAIVGCPQLNTIPSIHHLNTIGSLKFSECHRLESFTHETVSRSVQSLIITNCPLLAQRCKREQGMDWLKVHHISSIVIDYMIV